MVMFAPKVELLGWNETVELEKITSVPALGTKGWFAPPRDATQLLCVLPLEAAHVEGAPLSPPFQ
jgi:hypothetical protein